MAEGGTRTFTDSSYIGSDELFDFPCAPCSNEGNNIDSVNFCTDCSDYFCLACTKDHKKFKATSEHNVVDRTLAKQASGGGKSSGTLPTERCLEHHGERITTYCADHDLVVCNTCVSVDHRSCGGIKYIPIIAGASKQSKDLPQVKQQITESLKALTQAKLSIQKRQTTADKEKKKHLKNIQDYTERLIKHAHDLEKSAVEDVNGHHKSLTDKLQAEMKSIDDAAMTMKDRLKNLDIAHVNSDCQVFVDIKRGKKEVETARQLDQRLESTDPGKVMAKFVVEGGVDRYLSISSLGKIVENKPYKALLYGRYDVRINGDKAVCVITDTCELSDGKILMTDYCNCCIKELNNSYQVSKKSFKMPSEPWGISQTSQDEVAVTLTNDKKVHFVNVRSKWKLTRSFKVEDKCRGILYNKGEIFVSCGGHPGGRVYAPEGPGFVGLYDTTGSLLRKIQFDRDGRHIFSVPYHIVTSDRGNKLHIVDKKGGVVTVNRHGKVLWTFSENIQWAIGLCAVTEDSLVVGGSDSHNVLQIDADGNLVAELLNRKDGIKEPATVFFSRSSSRLIVTVDLSDQIEVFNLVS